MRKNLFLLFFIIIILALFYFFNKPKVNNLSSYVTDKIESIVINDSIINLNNKEFIYRHKEIKKENIASYLEFFKNVIILNPINKISTEKICRIKINKVSFEFFQASPLTGNFPMKINNQSYLAFSNLEYEGFFKNKSDQKLNSYQALLINLLDLRKNIFSPHFKNVSLFTRKIGDSNFTIDFNQKSISPESPQGIGYEYNAINDFKSKLEKLVTSDIQDLSTENLKKSASFIIDNQKFDYFEFDGKSYLKQKENVFLEFEMNEIDFLFKSPKSFWGKRILSLDLVDKEIPLEIYSENKVEKFKISKDLKVFSESLERDKIKEQAIREILCYLSYCNKKYGFLDLNIKENASESDFKMKVLNLNLEILIENSLLKVYNSKSKLEYTYVWSMMKNKNIFKGF